MALKKIQERSATYLPHPKISDPKSYQRQYRHPGTVLAMKHHQHGNLSRYLPVYPQNLLRHSETLTYSRPHLHVLDTRLAVGVVSSSQPTKAIIIAQDGVGVTEVEIRIEKGTDGARLLTIGGHHFWPAYRQMTHLEEK